MKIAKMLATVSPDEPENNDKLMDEYNGREDELINELQDVIDQTPFDEPTPILSIRSNEQKTEIVPYVPPGTPTRL